MINAIVPCFGGESNLVANIVVSLDERLMRAAEAVMWHGEHVTVLYQKRGEEPVFCRLIGRGIRRNTVKLGIWTPFGRRIGTGDVKFAEVGLPHTTALRLMQVAHAQERLGDDGLPFVSGTEAMNHGAL